MFSRRSFFKNAVFTGLLLGTGQGEAAANGAGKSAKNVIFMVADGMNSASLHTTRHFQKLVSGKDNVWLSLYNTRPVVRCMVETCSASSIVTDSSAASSCWGSGYRINNGAVNMSVDGRPLEPLLVKAKKYGMATGLVTTATATHATPAGFAANAKQRSEETLIARQYLERRVDVILGGGSVFFDNVLRADFKSAGYELVSNREGLLAQKGDFAPLLGLFAESHLPFSIDRNHSPALQTSTPTLAEMSTLALQRLGRAPGGFVLQIEAARVDHAAHGNDAAALIHDMIAFDEAIVVALDFVDKNPDTLLVITTDHGTGGFNINGTGLGYKDSANALLRLAKFTKSHSQMRHDVRSVKSGGLAAYLKRATGLHLEKAALRNAAHALGAQKALSPEEAAAGGSGTTLPLQQVFAPHIGIGWTGNNHTGDLVELAALGPGAARFTPFLRNDAIHWLILEALGRGESRPE
ncbi:MAG: alkaline phosphatase [Puniceicoccales bacterium]|nr:alkaline phosphatase [Puniceicoccales bacterium]